jgi:hypothetical protein
MVRVTEGCVRGISGIRKLIIQTYRRKHHPIVTVVGHITDRGRSNVVHLSDARGRSKRKREQATSSEDTDN